MKFHIALVLGLAVSFSEAPLAAEALKNKGEPFSDEQSVYEFALHQYVEETKNGEVREVKKGPPLLVLFPDDKTADGKDAKFLIDRLEFLRGPPPIYAEREKHPGLVVVFKSISFKQNAAGAEVIVKGAVKGFRLQINKETFAQIKSGEDPVVLDFKNIKVDYPNHKTTTSASLELQLIERELHFTKIQGSFDVAYTSINPFSNAGTGDYQSGDVVWEDEGEVRGTLQAFKELPLLN